MAFKTHLPNTIVSWFIYNPVAANLLMLAIIAVGIYSALTIKLESFPSFPPANISIHISYDGASAREIEQVIITKIERAVIDINGIESIESTATRGSAIINIKKVKAINLLYYKHKYKIISI